MSFKSTAGDFRFCPDSEQDIVPVTSRVLRSRKTQAADQNTEYIGDDIPASTRKRKRRQEGSKGQEDYSTAAASPRSRRLNKKPKRGYADPEVYAHLHLVQDYLQENLDVVFCGINPGYMSAETGHHFANPTNHFWQCLYQSGLTSTLLPPSEDYSLPERYNLGLTNIVDRPSTEAAELSISEMKAAIPAFLKKISRYRPRFVCFVGVGIWTVVQKALRQLQQSSTSSTSGLQGQGSKGRKARKGVKGAGDGSKQGKDSLGLQPYKLVHPTETGKLASETFLFVVPSTSGRVVRYQFSDKINYFSELRELARKPHSVIATQGMLSIVVETHGLDI
ncbi:uracil-DNA glycosylase-like protein [Pisolithus croceorrhizus]|nr:uracil-DNA glycosylase-like protein [Pisolithus croceorrhizus]KAI6107190.1 uracil-DNA glycosylase-like protein [Pisolithus croceorrhizus]KAI6143153.1 uracil-DNA glycosylase-like protein [Pisolithus thermaeus]